MKFEISPRSFEGPGNGGVVVSTFCSSVRIALESYNLHNLFCYKE